LRQFGIIFARIKEIKRESNMKAIKYISVLTLLILGSCTSSLYTGVESDDLYYLPSDIPAAATVARTPSKKQIAENTLKSEEYYDNIYAADTLVSDEYSDAVDYDNVLANEGQGGNIYNYYDNYSYAGRLNRFYGNYFYPYWSDPFYYDSYYYNPYYYNYGLGSYYGNYYGGYYGYSPYSSWYYSPYFNNWGYSSYIRDVNNSVTYGRRERQSTYSTKWNSTISPTSVSSRRDNYISSGTSRTDPNRRSATGVNVSTDARRTVTTAVNKSALNGTDVKSIQSSVRESNPSVSSRAATRSSSTVARPEYNSVNRSYTPSYSNPRMSTRPSYNNSRTGSSISTGRSTYPESTRSSTGRSSSSLSSGQTRSSQSFSSGQTRSSASYSSPASSYSMPSRRGIESGSGYSSGSSSGGFSNSRSSSSSSSYSSGSSSGGFSSGSSASSSGGSSRSSSGGGSTSGGRR
jgi:hypothetical protein